MNSNYKSPFFGACEVSRPVDIRVHFGRESIDIPVDRITLLEGHNNYTYIHTTDKARYLVCKTLKSMMFKVGKNFVRVHKSFVINITYVVACTADHRVLKLRCGNEAMVSRRKTRYIVEIIGSDVQQMEDRF